MQVTTDEAQRPAAVRRYQVLDTPPNGAFERITTLAARLFDVPIAIVSIVDADRIWFKSHHGLDVSQIDREPGLCASAVLDEGDVGSLVLDVRGLDFLDSSGLRALLVCPDRTQETGAEFRLAVAPGPVTRLLAVAGVQGWFDYE